MTASKATPIRTALRSDSTLRPLVKDGLGALLRDDRARIDGAVATTIGDSLDIDEAFRPGHESQNRWDYLLGHTPTGELVALEPHSANEGEISVVIKKREGALTHLREHLEPGTTVSRWFWVASGAVGFVPFEKAILRLSQNGITFVGRKLLPKDMPTAKVTKPTGKSKR